jgi:hypothetical protein
MDVSPDHEPTLIERGTDVHLNHPLAAQRGIRDSRPARWESWTPHPSTPRRGGEGAHKQAGELTPIASKWALARVAQRAATPPGHTPNAGECRYVSMAPPRLAETLSRPAEINTSHTGNTLWKNLAGLFTLLQGFGATPVGALVRPMEQPSNQEGRKSHQQAPTSAGS